MVGAFDGPVAHLALDDSWVAAQATWSESFGEALGDRVLMGGWRSSGGEIRLSSSFGGDLRASTVANRLLSRRFCDDIRVPELAHISPRREHDAIRAHRARHPCVVGRPPLAPAPGTKHSTARGQVRILRACPHGDQEPSARRPPNLPADGFCSKCPAHAEKPNNGSIEGRSEADRSLQRLGASRPRARRRLTAPYGRVLASIIQTSRRGIHAA